MSTVHLKPNKFSQTTTLSVSVPAKAMLFGEFAVLRGGQAVTALLTTHTFDVEFSLTHGSAAQVGRIVFESKFFDSPLQISSQHMTRLIDGKSDSEERNLACYLVGYEDFLSDKELSVGVSKSFSPELGFGSSSALLVAFQLAMFKLSTTSALSVQQLPSTYWSKLHKALMCLQGKGSGYDVATQSWAVLENERRARKQGEFLAFENPSWQEGSFTPVLKQLSMSPEQRAELGCFVRTGIRSDTRQVLHSTRVLQSSEEFCRAQSGWATEFIEQPTAATARRLCRVSSALARRHGLLAASPEVERFVDACDRMNIPWKTMGAGHGDCLWVIAPRDVVNAAIAQADARTMSVSFAFAEGASLESNAV